MRFLTVLCAFKSSPCAQWKQNLLSNLQRRKKISCNQEMVGGPGAVFLNAAEQRQVKAPDKVKDTLSHVYNLLYRVSDQCRTSKTEKALISYQK